MKIAKHRHWTEAEVHVAIATIKAEPGLWEELEQIERTTGDFTDTEVAQREWRVLTNLHPSLELHEKNRLYYEIRKFRRGQLGLS